MLLILCSAVMTDAAAKLLNRPFAYGVAKVVRIPRRLFARIKAARFTSAKSMVASSLKIGN
jgi:hypothetical protein